MSRPTCNAWLRLLRISNYPTVVTNAMSGCAIGSIGSAGFAWTSFALAAPALILLYAAGMAMNDALDAGVDRVERPDRPIPAGLVQRTQALGFAVFATASALTLLAYTSQPAFVLGVALAGCIVAYNALHRLHPVVVLIMAACRGLAIITAAGAAGWPLEWWYAAPMSFIVFVYTVAISLVARAEADNRRRVRTVVLMICGICLLDAAFLGVMGRWWLAGVAVVCFGASLIAQRRIVGS